MSLNLEPQNAILEDESTEIANNTRLLLELIQLQKRNNLILLAILKQLGVNGGIVISLADVLDAEELSEVN